eukprot:NODE_3996_length_616_cov_246.873016_g2873_i0.p3 GENE.NODE_3996_length_616_cov_246.873016_g2873_i0~~NODE_3996_length_616_cov_246.873016_g2873_i0.p3  ORF type:complete len:55 (-),score=2.19 NODE_3996_length_616_cov_246.873016_g2873_i0:126-290(-)
MVAVVVVVVPFSRAHVPARRGRGSRGRYVVHSPRRQGGVVWKSRSQPLTSLSTF